jgi:hypothetical protein
MAEVKEPGVSARMMTVAGMLRDLLGREFPDCEAYLREMHDRDGSPGFLAA